MRHPKSHVFSRQHAHNPTNEYKSTSQLDSARNKHSEIHPNAPDASRSRIGLSMALKGLLAGRRHPPEPQMTTLNNSSEPPIFKWAHKRRHGLSRVNTQLSDSAPLSSSLPSQDAPPLRYSNANLRVAGWLSKRGKRLGSKVNRFFQLNGSILSNSRAEHARPTWSVNVRGSKVLAGPGREIIFKVQKTFTSFFAPSDELHHKWIKALQSVATDVTDFYDFGKVIGRGAYSEVYLARDRQRHQLCAIKVLERSNAEHAKLIDRELEVLRLLNHQNIVQIYDIFDSARETFVVMEFVAGGELLDMITERDHLSEKNAKQVIREVLQSLQYLHARGIVHRDVKPENILCLNRDWPLRVKLTDFGLSKSVGNSEERFDQVMRSQCGTAFYLAPEIAKNLPYGKPVDLWASGVVLYVMLAGKFPFYGRSGDKFMRRLKAGVKFPDDEWNGISLDAKALVRGLLDPNPQSRLTSAQALQHRWLVEEEDVTASSTPSRAVQDARRKVQMRYNAATEPLSLQLAQFSGSRRRAMGNELGESDIDAVVRTDYVEDRGFGVYEGVTGNRNKEEEDSNIDMIGESMELSVGNIDHEAITME